MGPGLRHQGLGSWRLRTHLGRWWVGGLHRNGHPNPDSTLWGPAKANVEIQLLRTERQDSDSTTPHVQPVLLLHAPWQRCPRFSPGCR